MQRRTLLLSTLAAPTAALLHSGASAQTWPTNPITVIAPNAPGGPADTLARAITVGVSRELGVSVLVENKPGASGKIGIQAMLKAPRDGYTIAVTSITAMSALPVFSSNVGYASPQDFEPLSLAVRTPGVLVVHPSVPARTMKELAAYARANPGRLNYASFGEKSSSHLAFENLLRLLDVQATHVPFKSETDALNGIIGGHVQMMSTSGGVRPHVESGRLIAIGTSMAARWNIFPQVPTLRESGVPELATYAYEPWLGFSAAAGIPDAVRDRLANAIRNALRSPEATRQLEMLGYRVVASTPAEMRDAVIADIAAYQVLARSGRVKPE